MQLNCWCLRSDSDRKIADKHVKREIHLWLENDKPIVTVRLDATQPSPELRYLLAGMQWASTQDTNALLNLIKKRRAN